MAELVLKGGRVIDPGQNLDGIADVVFADGRVKAVGRDAPHGRDAEIRDAKGLIVTPGLIDLHTHVYWGGTSLGVDAPALARSSGTTTFVDAGSAGPGNFLGFRRHVIEPAPVRILPYLNISFAGIYAFSASVMVGECADVRLLDLRECRKVAEENRDLVVGIKVRVGRGAGGASGVVPLDMALEVAEAVGLPVMCHLDFPPPSRLEVVTRLRKGDVLTHCFRPFPNAPVAPEGGVREEIAAARERGVIFDIGHGQGSFGFGTARAMLAAGFLPDVISSDVHSLSIDGPAFDLLHTLSKFLVLGVPLPQVIKAATSAPAAAINRPELGSFKPGSVGDATLISVDEGEFTYHDVLAEPLRGSKKLAARGVVLGGKWWHP
ncbi:MAG TPA: amidohydrolase/deacetylase family metallohydrolase [Stellaceae bacterium]|nr:amidohydrolase/deacetylase family metallohydrolase [Stellaceae bacterium]